MNVYPRTGTIIAMLIGIFYFVSPSFELDSPFKTYAVIDQFYALEKFIIGDVFTGEIKSRGVKVENPPDAPKDSDLYKFESDYYSHPHFLYVKDGKITYIQLAIPQNEVERYNTLLASFGVAETTLQLNSSEKNFGFPSKGTAFIVSGITSQVLRIQKFSVKPVYEFESNEGKNFKPKDFLPTLAPPYNPPPSFKNAWSIGGMKQRVSPLLGWLPRPLQYVLFFAVIAAIIGGAVFFLRFLRRSKEQSALPPQPPPDDSPKPGNPE